MLNRREALLAGLALPLAGMVPKSSPPTQVIFDDSRRITITNTLDAGPFSPEVLKQAGRNLDLFASGQFTMNEIRSMEGLPRIES